MPKLIFALLFLFYSGAANAYPPCFDEPCISYDKGTVSYQIEDTLADGTPVKISSEIEVSFKVSQYRGEIVNQPTLAKPIDTTITIVCEDDIDCDSMDGLNRHAGERLIFYNDYLRDKPFLDLVAAKHFVYQAGKTALFTTTNSLSTSRKELLSALAKNFVDNLITQAGSPIVYIQLKGENGLVLHLKLELSNDYWKIVDTVEEGLRNELNQLTIQFNQSEYEAFYANRPWREHFLSGLIRMKRCRETTVTSTVVDSDGIPTRVIRTVTSCWYEYR
ncbi:MULTISPECIES: hypothetical protein [unclassified Shewanella]|uniref:hypothetical protein n=1 Tax=unclassified Shewanella TaxID=196818 RepID=UPI001BC3D25E|nr:MULTISPECIES: hypothetical protein [unclassified Shewanella]GIU07208.1 hypothetical protein TUM4444_06350 [Shewanella sp. MBTL60-112-B1]GIU35588.1 hypothetical protein TUM4445_25590 [Shewanella sp. MBTL60-112-B2]